MAYYCRFCEKVFEKTNPTIEQRKEYHITKTSYNYPGLYQHIEETHGYIKAESGKLIKKKV